MPNTIQIKRNTTANAVPTAGQLASGELAINTADGRLFAKNAANAIINLPVTSISGQDITPNTVDTVSLGAAATPAHSFSTDTDTGMYSPGANALAFATGGTQRIRVDSSGRVNIGTATSWTSRLLVDNGSMPGAAQTEIFQVLDSSSSGDHINLGRFNVNRNAARGSFSLSNSGSGAWQNNVMQFFVHGSTYAHGYYGGNNPTGGDAGCAMIVTQGSNIQKLQIGNYGNAPIEFFTDNTFRARIDSTGLDIRGNITNSEGDLYIGAVNSGSLNFVGNSNVSLDGSSWPLVLTSDVSVSITTAGAGSFISDAQLYLGSLGTITIDPDTANVVISPLGSSNVGIGTQSPTAKLDVAGDIKLSGALQSPGEMLYLWSNFR